jgi:pyruvate dehydrogenase E1 component alpha subunit
MLGIRYRTEEDIQRYREKCPVATWEKRVIRRNICTIQEVVEMNDQVEHQLEEAVDFARNSDLPKPENALEAVYSTEYEGIPQKGWM